MATRKSASETQSGGLLGSSVGGGGGNIRGLNARRKWIRGRESRCLAAEEGSSARIRGNDLVPLAGRAIACRGGASRLARLIGPK